ncbi:MAG: hypothetical protein QF473_02845 [Planctomycetota bacterium]|nr:hypothetical protein [Planctomycetota bacterium]MDP6501958.1 hypothetical protein [Planctomycetota bacterium]
MSTSFPDTTQELRAQLDDVFAPPFDVKYFRSLVEHCSEAQRIVLCRQLAASGYVDTKSSCIRILLEFGDEGIRFELRHVTDTLPDDDLERFIVQMLRSTRPDFQSFALEAIGRHGLVSFAPTLIQLWKELGKTRDQRSETRDQRPETTDIEASTEPAPSTPSLQHSNTSSSETDASTEPEASGIGHRASSIEHRASSIKITLASTLASFGTPALEAKLVDLLKNENEPAVIHHLLDLSINFRKARRYAIYEQYLSHPIEEVRFAAARGISITARHSQRGVVLKALKTEAEPRILEMLMNTALRIPDRSLAEQLFEMSVSIEDREQRNLATLHFRQLPDEMIYQVGHRLLNDKDEAIRTFALTELAFLELPQIPELLTGLACDDSKPQDIRIVAIEGLVNHNDIELRSLLYGLFLEHLDDFDFSYAIISALSKMWQEEDVEQITHAFELDPDEFGPHLEVVLRLISRRLHAHKWSLHERYIDPLHMFLDSENLNLCVLALDILNQSDTPVEVPTLLSIFTRQLNEELEAVFRPVFAAHLLDDIEYFFNWMNAPVRTDAQQHAALRNCEGLSGAPEDKAELFCRLITWPKSLHEDFSPVLKGVFDNLLTEPSTRLLMKARLRSQPGLTPAFLQNTYKLSIPHLREIGEDFLIENVESLTGDHQQMCCDALTRMQTKAARRRLMQLFIANEALKDRISLAMRRMGNE